MHLLPVITMGLSATLLQITALRQLLSVFSGNELVIGITLSAWLITVGTGSYTGWRLRHGKAFAVSFLAVAFLSQLTLIFINEIRPALSLGIGETASLGTTIISTILSLLPLCLVLGTQFPLAVSYMKGASAKVYGAEALAAFFGGVLFTFAISGRVNPFTLAAAISVINILTAFYLLRKKALIPLLLIPVIIHYGAFKSEIAPWKGLGLKKKIESRYGEIVVTETRGQSNLYLSGKVGFSYPDPQTEELKAHLPISVHPSPRNLLLIGGSPAVIRELLKYGVEGIDFVELDPAMVGISLDLLNAEDREILKDGRIRIRTEDARKYVKSLKGPEYDLITLNLPEPSTASINRFYTSDFFREARVALKEGGVIFLTMPTSSGYIGKRMRLVNGSIYNSLKSVFRYVEVSSEEYGCIFASDSPLEINPLTLEQRFNGRMVETRYFKSYILKDAFSPLKVSLVKERLGTVDTVNMDIKPLAYLYNLMLWSEVHGGGMLNRLLELKGWQMMTALTLLLLCAGIFYRGKTESVYFSIFTTGYAGMAFSLIIILAYQARYGYVYEMFGLLMAMFMAGIAAGSYLGEKAGEPLSRLRLLEAAMILTLASAPLFFKTESLFYILNFLCGLITGWEFAAANLFIKQEASRLAGRLYGIDLAGSFLGALLTAILLVPLLGIQNTIIFVVLLKAVSLILLMTVKYEKA